MGVLWGAWCGDSGRDDVGGLESRGARSIDRFNTPSAMRKYFRRSMVAVGVVGAIAYFGVYAYYRFVDDGGVIDCVGAFGHGNRAFTFSEHSRNLGDLCLSDSFAGPSLISMLSEWSGVSLAPTANGLYMPMTRLDHLFTGKWISFTDVVWSPPAASSAGPSTDSDPELEKIFEEAYR